MPSRCLLPVVLRDATGERGAGLARLAPGGADDATGTRELDIGVVLGSIVRGRDGAEAGRGGHDCGAAVPGPGHQVAGIVRTDEAFDARRVLVLVGVAGGAQALAVVDAGDSAFGERPDVVALAHGCIAEGGSAGVVAPGQEAFHRGRELAAAGFDGDQLSRGGVGEEAAYHGAHLWAVGAVPVTGGILGLAQRLAQCFAHRLRRDRSVAFDVGDIAVVRGEQGSVGDHHPDVESHGFHSALATEQGLGEGIGHQRAVPFPGALGATPFRFEGEPLVRELRVEGRQVRTHGGHAVLPGREVHMAVRACGLVTTARTVRVELADGCRHLLSPPLDSGAVHPRHPLEEHLVDLAALEVIERLCRGGGGVGDRRGDLSACERSEHPRHGVDQASRRRQAAGGNRGRASGRQGEIAGGLRIGLPVQAFHRRQELVLVGGVVACGVDLIAPCRLGERHHGPGLERVQGAASVVDHVEQILVLASRPRLSLEHRLRRGRDGGEQEVDIAQQLRERGGAGPAERSEELLRGRLGR